MKSHKQAFIGLCLLFGVGTGHTLAQNDRTALIANPGFEEGMVGWNALQMVKQTNTSFPQKAGNVYLEKWVSQGNRAGDAHIRQTIKSMPNGHYKLVVAAQNVQQNAEATQSGAWIVANDNRVSVGSANDYAIEFTVIEKQASIGFEAIGATGNYLACDNFRLYLIEDNIEVLKKELKRRIDEAERLLMQGTMGVNDLQTAIDAAKAELGNDTDTNYPTIAAALKKAVLAFRIANATGIVPAVTTHGFVARGATKAFGRSTVSGASASELLEQGFCWSIYPNPTVLDNRTTKYHTQNGRIYTMEDLTPSTIYYVRAYAMTKNYAVGYGDVVKVITLPKGDVTWSYDNGADAEANVRINTAVADAVDYFNQITCIKGLHANVHYGSGTPTADCSYGGWMRVGPNASYQKTGTILHELGHAIGVGQHDIWYGGNSPLRAGSGRGDWLGDRATAVARFLNNDNTSVMTGDNTHMWPYGINGSNEDNNDPMLYISNTLIYQALGEDGLPPTGGFATPAYSFEQEDTVKYYIKNESDEYGLRTSYLVIEDNKILWKMMSGTEALTDDHAAWYVTFNPKNSYYQLRNAATGQYIAHGGATSADATASNIDFHMMRSRVNTVVGNSVSKMNVRGYWLIQPVHTLTPPCLSAAVNGKVTSAAFNLTDAASAQRWVFMEANEVEKFEKASNSSFMGELDIWIARVDTMLAVPHTASEEGVDAALKEVADKLKEISAQSPSTADVAASVEMARTALHTYLSKVTPNEVEHPFDITYMMTNASIDDVTGWSEEPTFNYSCMEFYESVFDFNQTLHKMPKGVYQLRAQAFQRPGTPSEVYANYQEGNSIITTELYIGSKSAKIQHIAAEAQKNKLGGNESAVGNPVNYIPNDMQSASRYFDHGLYDNMVTMQQFFSDKDIALGIRSASKGAKFWTVFDNFRLYYYGTMSLKTVTDIDEPTIQPENISPMYPSGVYSMIGIRLQGASEAMENLPAGIYIVNGRKVIVK